MNHPRIGPKKNEFFKEISLLAEFCDERLVKCVYYSLIKLITRSLRKYGRITLPDWGDFVLVWYPPKRGLDVKSRLPKTFSGCKKVKFRPSYKLKEYYKNFK